MLLCQTELVFDQMEFIFYQFYYFFDQMEQIVDKT